MLRLKVMHSHDKDALTSNRSNLSSWKSWGTKLPILRMTREKYTLMLFLRSTIKRWKIGHWPIISRFRTTCGTVTYLSRLGTLKSFLSRLLLNWLNSWDGWPFSSLRASMFSLMVAPKLLNRVTNCRIWRLSSLSRAELELKRHVLWITFHKGCYLTVTKTFFGRKPTTEKLLKPWSTIWFVWGKNHQMSPNTTCGCLISSKLLAHNKFSVKLCWSTQNHGQQPQFV